MTEFATDTIKPVKIILTDDDKDSQRIFKDALSRTRIPVDLITADNGQQLMDTLRDPGATVPDVIFLDINMPGKDGKECLYEIKNDKDLMNIPTVMYSASDSEQDIEDTYRAGANLYITKPISFPALVSVISKVLTLNWNEYKPKPARQNFFVSQK